MNEERTWTLPQKITGKITPRASFRLDTTYQQALGILAKRESQRLGVQVSQATLIQNLTVSDANFFRTKRTELREIMEQLNKEKHRATNTTNQPEGAND